MNQSSTIAPDSSGRDLLGRVIALVENTDPILILVGIALLVILFFLAIFNRRNELLVALVTCSILSGAIWPTVDAGSTLIRWYLLIVLSLFAFRLRSNPGLSVGLYVAVIVLGLVMTVFSHDFMWSVQNGLLMLITVVAVLVATDNMDSRERIHRLMRAMLVPCAVWTILGLWFLPEMERQHGRFSGFISDGSAGVFNTAGSVLVPFAFWLMLQRERAWLRIFSGCLVVAMMILLIVSTQRTGTYAAVISFLPFLLRRKISGIFVFAVVGGLIALALAWLAAYNPNQLEYASTRFGTTSTTGRYELWLLTLEECLETPFAGRGFGADRGLADGHRPHNWYLSTWYATGVLGVLLTLGFMGLSILRSTKTTLTAPSMAMSDLGALALGQLLGRLASGFFATFNQPSSTGTLIMILMLILADRLLRVAEYERRSQHVWWQNYQSWATRTVGWTPAQPSSG